jgi:nicotinic acid mononucleotide adenylyltransferase
LGYPWLADDEVFPFYELRAAAVDLRGDQAFDANEAARRVAAQLDTLVEHGVRHAVLSAFGCGSFRNPADQVACIYRQELLKRATQFDVIAFAIFDAGYGPDNFMPFTIVFGGWPAGTTSYPFMRQTETLPTLSSTTAAVPALPPAASSHTPRKTHQVQDRSGLMSSSPSAENAPWPLTKSSQPPTATSPSCILVTTGAMNPLHKGHVAMLHQAAARVMQVGFHVCAAYLSPSHDGYVQPKARSLGTLGLSAAFRLALARNAVADDPLVAVASWEAEFPGNWPDFPAVCQAAQTEPRIASLARVFYVCGTDHASKCGLWQGKRDYGVVVVPRAGDALGRESPSDGVYLAAPAAGEVAAFSSSGLRAALARHDESAIASMVSPQALRMLLHPTAAELAAFASDYRQLGVAPLVAASVSLPAFPAEDASDYRQLANLSPRSR